jgi:DNA-binding NarL/FixJ family response regulator
MDKIKVLLVDDHPVVREGLCTILATAPDIEVVAEAGDGLEAVEKAIEHQPHIVLMDIRMPGLDGLEATQRIKNRLPSTSVIVLTVYDDDSYVVSAIKAGAGGYLVKDASKDLLIHTIRAVTSGGILIKTSLLREAIQGLTSAPAQSTGLLNKLTPREQQVLQLIVQGQTNKEIGQTLHISEDTTKKYVQSILLKLDVSDRTQAAVKAVRAGLSAPRKGPPPA